MREKVIQYLSTSTWKDLTDVRSGDIIPCVICDEMIEGHVYVSPKDINVTLHGVKPQLRASSHIMLMAPKIYTIAYACLRLAHTAQPDFSAAL